MLVAKKGQLVSREEIVEKLWGRNVFVDSEHGVNTAIRKVRQVLNDDREQPRFIETIVGKGYRFVAAIKVVPARTASEFVSQNPAFGRENGHSSGIQPTQLVTAELLEGKVPRQQTEDNSEALERPPGAVGHVALLIRRPLKAVPLWLRAGFLVLLSGIGIWRFSRSRAEAPCPQLKWCRWSACPVLRLRRLFRPTATRSPLPSIARRIPGFTRRWSGSRCA